MSSKPLRLPPDAYEDLERIASNPTSLRELSNNLDLLRTAPTVGAAVKRLAAACSADEGELEVTLPALMALSSLRRNVEKEVRDYLDLLDSSLEAGATGEWKQRNLSNWRSCRPSLEVILDSGSALSLFEKANRLGYSHARTLFRTEIITDLRPVFDATASKIERMSASFMLSIEYSDGGRVQSLDMALDLKDIARLHEQCARAKTKAASIKAALQGQPWITTIVGDDEEGA
ncbi:hypothetical protein [Paraliomyxa miuraensis]|uniref:hypothetical protein n=1 Tax=Paraliomyxa miuraensis TaxID=376150 RepID=UPI00224E7A3C|nr:hypothetical protein [Paraliomyxa miuraensis]MCX4239253.1 hypothetical protein [Paraliomyxa miuraensis]